MYKAVGAGLIAALLTFFVFAVVLMAVRDHNAVSRCHDLGGRTYDSGQHCTIGGRTVNTR